MFDLIDVLEKWRKLYFVILGTKMLGSCSSLISDVFSSIMLLFCWNVKGFWPISCVSVLFLFFASLMWAEEQRWPLRFFVRALLHFLVVLVGSVVNVVCFGFPE